MKIRSVCVYCGSSVGRSPSYRRAASAFGALLASRGVAVVYGGGNVGLMGALADAALECGGKVVGVIPHSLAELELAHLGLTELHTVQTMHERKWKMADLSDAFVALPGGIGTMEELFEAYTWRQLGFHDKPCAVLDVEGFYEPLLALLDRMVEQRFVKPEHRAELIVETDGERLLEALEAYQPRQIPKV